MFSSQTLTVRFVPTIFTIKEMIELLIPGFLHRNSRVSDIFYTETVGK